MSILLVEKALTILLVLNCDYTTGQGLMEPCMSHVNAGFYKYVYLKRVDPTTTLSSIIGNKP